MSEPKLIKARIADFIPDDKNANQGTDRGEVMLQTSIAKFGAGRSILIDKNNRIIGGNKTWSKADLEGLQDAIIVETDGKQLVAVKRTDIDLDTPLGREMAVADNRTGQVNLNWDYEILGELSEDVDLEDWFTEEEMKGWDVEDSGENLPESSAQEIDVDAYEFDCKCPKCGFEFIQQK